MAFTKTLFLSLLAILSVNTIAIAPIHAVGVGETWNHYPPTSNAQWAAITFGNGRFVAVANTGSSHVMVSVVPVIESGPPPPPWLQSYALSGDETNCMDGWSQSWAQWPNDNSGGFVCNRSIYWSSGAQAWLEKPGF